MSAAQEIQSARIKRDKGVPLVNRERVLLFIADGKPHTGFEIAMGTGLYRFGAYLKELRDMGLDIETRRKSASVFEYRLMEDER